MTKKTQKHAGKVPAVDPIFALIEKHRAAEAAFCRAVDVYNKITEGKHQRIEDDAKVWVGGHRIESPDDLPEWRRTVADAIEHLFGAASGPHPKRRLRARALFTKAIAANVEGLKRTFADEQRKIDHLRITSGYDAANKQYHATCDASRDALTKLIRSLCACLSSIF